MPTGAPNAQFGMSIAYWRFRKALASPACRSGLLAHFAKMHNEAHSGHASSPTRANKDPNQASIWVNPDVCSTTQKPCRSCGCGDGTSVQTHPPNWSLLDEDNHPVCYNLTNWEHPWAQYTLKKHLRWLTFTLRYRPDSDHANFKNLLRVASLR